MGPFALLAAVICVLASPAARAAEPARPLPDIGRASWAWASPSAATEGEFACLFRRTFDLGAAPAAAMVAVTADNGYDLFVNGSLVGGESGVESDVWSSVEAYRVEHLLHAGRNVIAVRGENLGGPAGLVAAARVDLEGGGTVELVTDSTWLVAREAEANWVSVGYDDRSWKPAVVLGPVGIAPWGALGSPSDEGRRSARLLRGRLREPDEDYRFPEGIIFVRGRTPQSSTPGAPQSVWPIDGSRAYLENDTPGPAAPGRELLSLVPARPGGKLTVLVSAGRGLLGSPSVSWDGKTIYFAMAPEGDPFFHIYRVSSDGTGLAALTRGSFHDFDPEPLPDGRIVFSSTRIGSREEYHGNVARSLYTLEPGAGRIRPLTHHIVADVEPRVTADGEVAFVRCDNFMERAKVETHIHVVRTDGTGSRVLLGPDRGSLAFDRARAAEGDGRWLRNYGFGSLASLPDGRLACISAGGVLIVGPDGAAPLRLPASVFDISPLPEPGKVLCTSAFRGAFGVLDLRTGDVTRIHSADTFDIHSVVHLAPRPQPPLLAPRVDPAREDDVAKTGTLVCQSVFRTKQTAAELSRIKAVRIFEAVPFTNRPARHPYAHVGVDATELGTAPLWPDGSFHVEVPADRALAIQLIDGEGRSVLNELSWIYVRPGERRACTGCHEPKNEGPPNRPAMALSAAPVPLLGKGKPHRFRGNNAANGGVLNLQFDRFREAASINLHGTAPALAASAGTLPPGRAAEVKALCDALASGSEGERAGAAERLGIFRDRAAVPALLAALGDRSPAVRRSAALALGACGDRRAAEGLGRTLSDRSAAVAQAARVGLETLAGPLGPAALEAGWDKLEAELVAALDGEDPARTQQAIEALGHVGGDAARRALRERLKTRGEKEDLLCALATMRALGQLRDAEAVPLLAEVLRSNVGEKPADSPGLHELGWLQGPVHRAAAAAEALGWIGTSEAEAALVAVVPELRPFWYYTYRSGDHSWLMGCHSSVLHHRIHEALDAMGSRRVAEVLPHVLRSIPIDTDRALLFELDSHEVLAGRLVHRSGLAPQVLETCLAVLGDPSATRAEGLVDAVTASPPAESVGPLEPASRAAQVASIACGSFPAAAAPYAQRLRAAFDRLRAAPPSRERSWACSYLARGLGALGDPALAPSLLAALVEEAPEADLGFELPPNVFTFRAMTPFHRAAAARALGAIGSAESVPALLDAAGDFRNALDVRHAAAKAVEEIAARAPGAIEGTLRARIEAVAASHPEHSTRRELQRALAAASPAEPDPPARDRGARRTSAPASGGGGR
ncbi:MAG: HEAT repeat domain-containing protein [Planctomycetes bacterium]|nr:HEAT repeat domain-containing protein [Planctomycetota bacterium]